MTAMIGKGSETAKEPLAKLAVDAVKTVIAPGTKTCIAIGPDDEDNIDKITGKLKMV